MIDVRGYYSVYIETGVVDVNITPKLCNSEWDGKIVTNSGRNPYTLLQLDNASIMVVSNVTTAVRAKTTISVGDLLVAVNGTSMCTLPSTASVADWSSVYSQSGCPKIITFYRNSFLHNFPADDVCLYHNEFTLVHPGKVLYTRRSISGRGITGAGNRTSYFSFLL